jgi:prepilin-type N-terminal cleavage/methylation domain-containing protein
MRLKIIQFNTPPRSSHCPAGVSPQALTGRSRGGTAGFTLVEVVVAAAIVAVVFGGVINSYIQSGQRLQWTGYSLAAQQMANSVLEQAKSGVWDPTTPENDLTNLNLLAATYNSSTLTYSGYTTNILDVPYSSTNYVIATNFVTVQMINVSATLQEQVVRVDTVWPFYRWKGNALYTNTVITLVAPDNRSQNSF